MTPPTSPIRQPKREQRKGPRTGAMPRSGLARRRVGRVTSAQLRFASTLARDEAAQRVIANARRRVRQGENPKRVLREINRGGTVRITLRDIQARRKGSQAKRASKKAMPLLKATPQSKLERERGTWEQATTLGARTGLK